MVTSGVVPGIVMFQLLKSSESNSTFIETTESMIWKGSHFNIFQFIGLILTLGACYRLAKFNIDTRQTESFIGLPTPARRLCLVSLP